MRVAPAFTLLALLGALPSANAALIAETGAAHDTFAGAQDLSGSFSKDFVDEIFNSTPPTMPRSSTDDEEED